MSARVVLRAGRARPFYGRHPWVYPGAIEAVTNDPADGDAVEVHSHAGNFIAHGLYNSKSKIRVRLYSWQQDVPIDEHLFRVRFEEAIRLRRDILKFCPTREGAGRSWEGEAPAEPRTDDKHDAETARQEPRPPEEGQACRLIFSEGDGLSGLTVDRYDRWLVVQITGLGIGLRREMLADLLMEIAKPEGIFLRTERGIGRLEGLELHDGPLRGNLPAGPVVIEEAGVRFQVNIAEGQKTGFYLDQRDNRQAAARYATSRRVLDAFCYTGGFGLHCARAGAVEVIGLDSSEPALELARANADLNEFAKITFRADDVFDQLDALVHAGERFGMVVLDPPKFARAQHAVPEAMRGYRQLQTQALRLLDADGILVVCCCSGLITREMLEELLSQLAAETGRRIQILEVRGQSPDHPVAATCPESSYLKCLICRIL